MIDFLFSGALFVFVLFALLPLLCIKFLVLQFVHSSWLGLMSILYPELEFIKTTTVRTLLDTHRNQGIAAVLLCVKGSAQPESVKRHLQELVNRKSKSGGLAFPRLRDVLVTRCGTYAWQKVEFDLEKNLTVVPGIFKSRPVTEYNIQEYVSDLVSKYLPQNSSPWHFIIIPTLEDHHYILLKLHHILLNESLNIGDLLPLIPPSRQSSGFFSSQSPLTNVLKKPDSILLLKEHLTTELCNYWNEFLSNYDPLENTELLKNTPSISQFLAITLVTLISTLKEIKRSFHVVKPDISSRMQYVSYIFEREMKKRKVDLSTFVKSIFVSLDPRNLVRSYFGLMWIIVVAFAYQIPRGIFSECLALYQYLIQGYCSSPNTIIGVLSTYIPLTYGVIIECFEFIKILFYAPRNIIMNILFQKEYLQTVTLCGRKCVSWSDPIEKDEIKKISKTFGVSELEVLLAGFTKNFSKYLNQVNHVIPDEVAISLRNINSNYIFGTGVNLRPEDSCSGIMFMSLPTLNEEKGDTVLENLVRIKNSFRESLENQHLSYFLTIMQTKFGLLTKLLPPTLLAIYLRYLSRKFAIFVTEVSSRHPNVTQRTLWGKEVNSVIYWRPPQANICISLCLNEYADHVKLGVMCDARLVPHQMLLTRGFSNHIKELGHAADL